MTRKVLDKVKEIEVIREARAVSEEAIEHSKKIKREIDKQSGIKKVINYSLFGAIVGAVAAIPIVPTVAALAVVAGRIGWKKYQHKKQRNNSS